jgi:hyperosmotically inducible protein
MTRKSEIQETLLLLSLLCASSSFADKAPTQPDNSGINKRDTRTAVPVADDQASGTKDDVELTRKIRRAITKDDSLSVDAHNIKILSLDGEVTLRGPVKSEKERQRIAQLTEKVVGKSTKITNNLEIAK